jgi:hypothetical protein
MTRSGPLNINTYLKEKFATDTFFRLRRSLADHIHFDSALDFTKKDRKAGTLDRRRRRVCRRRRGDGFRKIRCDSRARLACLLWSPSRRDALFTAFAVSDAVHGVRLVPIASICIVASDPYRIFVFPRLARVFAVLVHPFILGAPALGESSAFASRFALADRTTDRWAAQAVERPPRLPPE